MTEKGRYAGVTPPDKPTAELPKADIIEGLLRAMQREMSDGFASNAAEISAIKGDVIGVKSDLHGLVVDKRIIHDRLDNLERRVSKSSGTFREVRTADEEQNRLLAEETAKRKALEAELLATRERLDTLKDEMTTAKTLAVEAKGLAVDTKTLAVETKSLTEAQTEELAKQTAILTRLSALASNPVVKDFLRVVATAIVTWLALKGIK